MCYEYKEPTLFERWEAWMRRRGSCRQIFVGAERGLPEGEQKLYLERFFLLRIPGVLGVFLHRFHMDDPDEYHDHPWDNVTLALTTYKEEFHDGSSRFVRPGRFYFRNALMLHRVKQATFYPKPWSIFIHFKRKREWGFYRHGEWVNADISDGFRPLKSWVFPHEDSMIHEA